MSLPNLQQLSIRDSGSNPVRPGKGKSGKAINVQVNIFPVRVMAELVISQYDVKFEEPKLPFPMQRRAFRQLETHLKKTYHDSCFFYDGNAIAYSTKSIPDCSLSLVVEKNVDVDIPPMTSAPSSAGSMNSDRGGRGGGRGGRGGGRGGGSMGSLAPAPFIAPSLKLVASPILTEKNAPSEFEKVTIKIAKTNEISMHELLLFAAGKANETEMCMQASNSISVALRYIPSILYTPVGNEFYSPVGRMPIMGGLELWKGFHQSVRAMMAGHLGINVDIANTIFRKGGITLLDYIMQAEPNIRNPKDISRLPPKALQQLLRGVNVVTTHRGDQKQRFKIAKVTGETPRTMKFEDKDKKKISVLDYFQKEYKIRLTFPDLPLVWKANGKTAFPIECLSIVPAQRVSARLNSLQTADVIKFTCQPPAERKHQIEQGVQHTLRYNESSYLSSLGLKIEPTMMTVPARILPAPKVMFKGNKTANGSDGAWNLRDYKLVNAPLLSSMAFVFYVQFNTDRCLAIRDVIVNKWKQAGMNITAVSPPVVISNPNSHDNIRGALKNAFLQAKTKFKDSPQLIVCIIDPLDKIYETIKQISLCEAGIVTQCMLHKNVSYADGIKDQYIANVALKANIKIGGSTNLVDRPLFQKDKLLTMFVGIDVTHAAPGSLAPSIAAVVCSTDVNCTIYNTYLIQQGNRVEVIASQTIGDYFVNAVKDFKAANQGKAPQRIVVYRDGVASGQFAAVKETEIMGIKRSLEAIKCSPVLTYVIVQKRHHLRLFPIDNNQDRSGNAMPGTVIDTTIMHSTEFNFLLQSHAGLQGTSRPTVYHVLLDESKFSPDELQQLTFNLCFLAERATRSINMVAPCYRAHIAAYYARMFVNDSDASSSTGSSGGKGGPTIAMRNFAIGMERKMYYM